jgi:hypothetical protein
MIPSSRPVVLDVSAVLEPDMSDVDALAGLQLLAHRLGSQIALDHVGDELRSLIEFAGLGELLLSRAGSVLESDREVEQREQAGVDEEVDPGDAIV